MNRSSRKSVIPALLIAAVLLMVGLAGTATAAKLITGKYAVGGGDWANPN